MLLTTQSGSLPVPEADPDQVRRSIDAILARPEFAPPSRSLLERARDWAFERLVQLLDALVGSGAGSTVGWVVVALITVAAVVLAVRFSRGLRADPSESSDAIVGPRRSAVDWRALAAGHEAVGEWRAALRCRWRALVADLARLGVLEEVPGRTAGEYRRQLSAALPSAATDFDSATELFEAAWYGDRPADPSQAEKLRALSERVLGGWGSSS